MIEEESAVPRSFMIDVTKHFKKISNPPPEKDRPAPKDAVAALLPKNTAESEAVLAKQQDLADLESAIKDAANPVVKKSLQASADSLRKEIEALPKADGNDTETKTRRDIAALKKIHANCELELSERKTKVKGHAAVTVTNKQDFLAEITEARAKLDQLELQYEALTKESTDNWEKFNSGLTNHKMEIFSIVAARLAELDMATKTEDSEIKDSQAATGDRVTTQQVMQAATAGDEGAQKMFAQLDHRADVQLVDLREIELDPPQPEEMAFLAHLWAVSEVYGIEDQMSVITFADTNLHPAVFSKLLGDMAWNKIFGEAQPQPESVIPFQVRQLVGLQLRWVSATLQEEQHAASRKNGATQMKKVLGKVRTETLKVKTSMKKA